MTEKETEFLQNVVSKAIAIEIHTVPTAPVYDESSKMIKIEKIIIVKEGTVNGEPTLDMQCVDSEGNKYLIMTTFNMMLTVVNMAQVVRGHT